MGTRKYITRDFTQHEFSNEYLSDEDEYVKLEIFSFDPKYEKVYLPEAKTLKGENVSRTSWKSWACFRSKDKISPMEFTLKYKVSKSGLYRIDVVYEQNSNIYDDKDYNSHKDLSGWYDIYLATSKAEHKAETVDVSTISAKAKAKAIKNKDKKGVSKAVKKAIKKAVETSEKKLKKPSSAHSLKFEGENNVIKRKTIFKNLNKGTYKFEFGVPHNCYVMGFIVRKVLRFWGTNNDEAGSNLQFTHAKYSHSDMNKPAELEATIGYDDDFECDLNNSGLYMDYMDECNLYVRDVEGKIKRVFGGYVSTPIPDNDRKQITIHCASRLKDGENKYILDQLLLQEGDGSSSDYDVTNSISFNKYSEALAYLCQMYEVTLKSNISTNYKVAGEKFKKGFTISFGKKKNIKKIPVSNAYVTINKNSVTLRNKPSGKKKQVWTLYDAKKHSKKPINISQYNTEELPCSMHLVYGLGDPKTEKKRKDTTTVDVGSSTAGAVKFSKCGVSADKKYVMAIGQRSSAKDPHKSYSQLYECVFENHCPHCGKDGVLRWDSCRSDTKCIYTQNWRGTKGTWHGGIPETEITCTACDSDYSVFGVEKDSPWYKLKRISMKESTKARQTTLHKGEMYAVPNGKASVSAKNIFQAIKNASKGWRHSTGTGTTASYLEKHGVGDCWAWSDWISKQLRKYKVNNKILQENGGTHRSVVYQNSKGKYVSFPYREYNFPTGTRDTAGSRNGDPISTYTAGGRINQAVVSGSTTKTQTTETTITKGYDKENPIQGYFDIVYSTSPSFKAKKYHLYVDFTQKAKSDYTLSGLKPVWVNNSSKKITLRNVVNQIRNYRGNVDVYLHSISFIAPKIKSKKSSNKKKKDDSTNWYTYDKNTQDNSSCKMILYSITFDNQQGTDPSDLQACGKSVNAVMQDIVGKANYLVDMEYAQHRHNDKISFKIDNNNTAVFTATEGNNNNILEWGNISYNPANELFNMSMCVFKRNKTNKYAYVDTRYPQSIMKYQEQCTLITENEAIGAKEAYWNARHNEKLNPEQTYSFTVTVKGFPDVRLKELVQVVANAKKLNTLKECESVVMEYDYKTKPVIQTELGLGELAPDIQVRKNIRKLRDNAKKETTDFFGTATPITDENVYEWDI